MPHEPRRNLVPGPRARLLGDPSRLLPYAAVTAALGLCFCLASAFDRLPPPLIQALFLLLLAFTAAKAARTLDGEPLPAARRAPAAVLLIAGEGAAILGVAIAARESGAGPGPLAAGFLALAGVLALSFARVRIRASAGVDLSDGPYGIASREFRLILLPLGVLVDAEYAALLAIAAACHAVVFLHLWTMRRTLNG